MAELKTQKTDVPIDEFLAGAADGERLQDCRELLAMMRKATGDEGAMWGPAIAGFGPHAYVAGKSVNDWFQIGFSPRKGDLSIYVAGGSPEVRALLPKLGKHKATAGGCVYVKRLADVDRKVLAKILDASVAHARKTSAKR
jgi:hypothetical protein